MIHKVVVTLVYCAERQLAAVVRIVLCLALGVVILPASAALSVNKSTTDLEYGAILFDYFQQDCFSALIEQVYAQAINNSTAKSPRGQVLKGGMMLSYGMADEAKRIFETLLDSAASEEVKNRAWFYLAKLFYSKSDLASARESLGQIRGRMPDDLHTDYHYLATLLNHEGNHLAHGGTVFHVDDFIGLHHVERHIHIKPSEQI